MLRKNQTLRILTVLTALWAPLYGGYVAYDGLVEADFLSPTLIFENPDQDTLALDYQGKWKPIPAGADSNRIRYAWVFSGPVLFFFSADSPSPLSLSLRC